MIRKRNERLKKRAIAENTYIPTLMEEAKKAIKEMANPNIIDFIFDDRFHGKFSQEEIIRLDKFIYNINYRS